MNFDNSWNALLKPGEARHYFDLTNPESLQVNASGYSPINAWWLAELSRLIYKRGRDEPEPTVIGPSRNDILDQVTLQEVWFCNKNGVQCAIVKPQNERRDGFAVLVFRGTDEPRNWRTNLNAFRTRWPEGGLVHQGFRDDFDKVWDKIDVYLSTLHHPIFYTGHSSGAALATLAASRRPPQALYTFGSPRVGNAEFARTLEEVQTYRIVNHRDIVAGVPPSCRGFDFCHVGKKQYLGHDYQFARSNPRRTSNSKWLCPPRFLADHAPINYVAQLERCI